MNVCQACQRVGKLDRAHIRSKGAGGSWEENNILHLCRWCHQTQHRLGWFEFLNKYPHVHNILLEKGWVIEEQFGRKRLVKK